MLHKNLIFVFLGLLMISCSGTVPSVGNEVSVQEVEESNEVAAKQEVSVETFTVQEPESPPLPVTVFEPYMIKRGDFLTKIALREYGDASMWRDIYSWNKDEIGDNPDRLYPYNFLSLKRESTDVRDCEPDFLTIQFNQVILHGT